MLEMNCCEHFEKDLRDCLAALNDAGEKKRAEKKRKISESESNSPLEESSKNEVENDTAKTETIKTTA